MPSEKVKITVTGWQKMGQAEWLAYILLTDYAALVDLSSPAAERGEEDSLLHSFPFTEERAG